MYIGPQKIPFASGDLIAMSAKSCVSENASGFWYEQTLECDTEVRVRPDSGIAQQQNYCESSSVATMVDQKLRIYLCLYFSILNEYYVLLDLFLEDGLVI